MRKHIENSRKKIKIRTKNFSRLARTRSKNTFFHLNFLFCCVCSLRATLSAVETGKQELLQVSRSYNKFELMRKDSEKNNFCAKLTRSVFFFAVDAEREYCHTWSTEPPTAAEIDFSSLAFGRCLVWKSFYLATMIWRSVSSPRRMAWQRFSAKAIQPRSCSCASDRTRSLPFVDSHCAKP